MGRSWWHSGNYLQRPPVAQQIKPSNRSNRNVLQVLKHEWSSQMTNQPNDGSRQGKAGRDTIINLSDELQIQIIVDFMSSGLVIAQMHQILNVHRERLGLPSSYSYQLSTML